MSPICVLHGPSGSGLRTAWSKVAASFASNEIEHVDLEDVLSRLILSEIPDLELPERSPLQVVLYKLPKDLVRGHFWPAAARQCLQKLLQSTKPLRVLTCHLCLYRGQTREFYEAGDLSKALDDSLSALLADGAMDEGSRQQLLERGVLGPVITLIDDVFDMFARLSDSSEVFPVVDLVRDEYRRRRREGRPPPQTPGEKYILAVEQAVSALSRVLDWRTREIAHGDSLADRAGTRHFLLSVKHPSRTLVDVLESECLRRTAGHYCYLSHPISRPRKEQRRGGGSWPGFVTQLQNFVDAILLSAPEGHRVVLFQPTCIDEYRFLAPSDPGFPGLSRRWPPVANPKDLLASIPPDYLSYEEYERDFVVPALFNPQGGAYDPEKDEPGRAVPLGQPVSCILTDSDRVAIQGLLGGLQQQIRIQLAMRDHALVRQTGSLLLFRPCFAERKFSGGVTAEIQHWHSLRVYDEVARKARGTSLWSVGPAIYVHDSEDLPPEDQAAFKKNLRAAIYREWGLEFALDLPVEHVSSFNQWFGSLKTLGDDLLGGGGDPKQFAARKARLEELWQIARQQSRNETLAGIAIKDPQWMTIVERTNLGELRFEDTKKLVSDAIIPSLLRRTS